MSIWTADILDHICAHLSLRHIGMLCRANMNAIIRPKHEIWLKAGQKVCGLECWPTLRPLESRIVMQSDGRYIAMTMVFPWLGEPLRLMAAPLQGIKALDGSCTVHWFKRTHTTLELSATISSDTSAFLGSFDSDVVMSIDAYDDTERWTASSPDPVTLDVASAAETELLGRVIREDLLPEALHYVAPLSAHIMHANLAFIVCGADGSPRKAVFISPRTLEILHTLPIEHIVFAPGGIWILDEEFNLTYRGLSHTGKTVAFEPTHENARLAAFRGHTELMLAFLRRHPVQADYEPVSDIFRAAIRAPTPETVCALVEVLPSKDALIQAILADRLDIVRALIQRGRPVLVGDIRCAANGSSLEMMQTLLDAAGSIASMDIVGHVGYRTSDAVLELLIGHGMRTDGKPRMLYRPCLPCCLGNGRLQYAVRKGNAEMIKALLENGVDPTEHESHILGTVLEVNAPIAMAQFFIDRGCSVANACGLSSMPLLSFASPKTSPELLKYFIDAGARTSTAVVTDWMRKRGDFAHLIPVIAPRIDLNAAGPTPLMYALSEPANVAALLRHGADPARRDALNRSVWEQAAWRLANGAKNAREVCRILMDA